MLVPVSRVSGTMGRGVIRHALPAIRSTQTHFFKSFKPAGTYRPFSGATSSASNVFSGASRIIFLFGVKNTDRVVGSAALHRLLYRPVSLISAPQSMPYPVITPVSEPYRSVIKSVESEFQRLGYTKTYTGQYGVTFSDGTKKIEIISEIIGRPSENAVFISRRGKLYELWTLRMALHPETFEAELEALKDILIEYGVGKKRTPNAVQTEGIRLYLELGMKQMIQFLESNQYALHDI